MQQNMKWRDLIEFVNSHPELLDEDVKGFNNDTDTLYNLDFIEFVEHGDILPAGSITLTFSDDSYIPN